MSSLFDRKGRWLRTRPAGLIHPRRHRTAWAWWLLLLGAISLNAQAQAGDEAQTRYRLSYRSVFEQDSPQAFPGLQSWPQSNRTVQEIGGWRSYLKSTQPDAANAARASEPAAQGVAAPGSIAPAGQSPASPADRHEAGHHRHHAPAPAKGGQP